MAGEIEEPFPLNLQAVLLQSGSISFGRFESESLSWERRSVFPHNRYLEEVEKYSKPGSVTEKKAYFEAEFRRKALLKQRSSECQDGGEFPTVTSNDPHDFEEYGDCNEGPCSSNTSKCNTETEIQHHEKGDVACFGESTPNSGYDEDTISPRQESENFGFHPITTQDELGETDQSENENVAGKSEQSIGLILIDHVVPVDMSSEATISLHRESENFGFHPVTTQDELGEKDQNENVAGKTEQSIGLTVVDHVVPVDVSSEANDDSSLTCQTAEKDHVSISSASVTKCPPKVKPTAKKKLTRSTLKTRVNADLSSKQFLNGGYKGSMKPRTSESKGLPVKQTENKSIRPASPLICSGVKTLKTEELRSEKAVKVKAQFPLSEKSLPGVRPTVNRSKPAVNPSKTRIIQSATGFSFKTDQRAENRKEFYTKITEKMHAKEVEVNKVEAKKQEKQAAEMKQFRKSLNFKAKPLPSFYNESVRGSDQHKVTPPISKTPNQPRPRSQAMATRHDNNPVNIRPRSSTSSTRRNHASEKKDTKLNKQKDEEPRGRDMVKRNVKGIHTWNGPKVGVVS